MQTVSGVRPAGRCDRPPSAKEREPTKKRTGGSQEETVKLLEHHSLVPTVRQDPLLGSSETFSSFLHQAQQEIQHVLTEEISLEMLLGNGQKVLVNMLTSDQTEYVLEGVAAKLDIPDDLIGYFSLFLVREK